MNAHYEFATSNYHQDNANHSSLEQPRTQKNGVREQRPQYNENDAGEHS